MADTADTTISLEIVKSDTVPVPGSGDTIPWCIALATRASNPNNRNGHRQKKKGYYYRYSGGNTYWDDGTPIGDGDFAFPPSEHSKSKPIKQIDVKFNENTKDWKFDSLKNLKEGSPLQFKITVDKDKVVISDDTSKLEVVSGNFGVVVKNDKEDEEIYCDPNWQNV
jgi:hypothetical protein